LVSEEVAKQNWGAVKNSVCIKDIDKYHVENTTHNHRPEREREREIYLEVPVAFPKLIVRRRREGAPINIRSIFYIIHFAKSNFTPKLLHVPIWETTCAVVFLREHFIGHFLIVSESVLLQIQGGHAEYFWNRKAEK
jgi:hypothetical protein